MEWLFYSLLATAILGGINVTDKIVIKNYIKIPIIFTIFVGLYDIIPAIIMVFIGIKETSFMIIIVSILAGALSVLSSLFYFKSLQISDASVVASALQMTPIFSFIWGYFFFNEKFIIINYFGAAIILTGITIITREHKENSEKKSNIIFSPIMSSLIPCTFLMSISYTLQKYTLQFTSVPTVFYWGRIGGLLTCVLLFCCSTSIRTDVMTTIKKIPKKINILIILSEMIFQTVIFMEIIAFSMGPLSLVSTVISAQPLYVLFYVICINQINKRLIVDHATGNRISLIRIFLIFVIIFGIYLISL